MDLKTTKEAKLIRKQKHNKEKKNGKQTKKNIFSTFAQLHDTENHDAHPARSS